MAKQAPVYVVFDGGNSLWKTVLFNSELAPEKKELVIPHAIVEDEGGSRFANIQRRFYGSESNDPDWIRIDNRYFVIGVSAETEGVVTRRTGSAKYTRDYFGVAFMASLLHGLGDSHNNIHVYASFPPGDSAYVDDLVNSIIGKWYVGTASGKIINFHIRSVQPFDEPLGGYICAACDPNGVRYKDSHLSSGDTLIIDIGGKVSSVMRVKPGARVQYGNARSIDIGIQDVVDIFTNSLKQLNPEVKGMRSFNDQIVRDAISTGKYQFKGRYLDCSESVRKATITILNRLNDFYTNSFEGGANDAQVLVTGGGGGTMFKMLKHALNHERMFMAEKPEHMHLANVRGGERMFRAELLKARAIAQMERRNG